MSNQQITLRQLESKLNEYARNIADEAAKEAAKLLDKRMKMTIAHYYNSYDPIYYNKNYPGYGEWHGARIGKLANTENIYKIVTKGIGNRGMGYKRVGGLKFDSSRFRPSYEFKGMTMDDIYTDILLHGRHGYESLWIEKNSKSQKRVRRPIVTSEIPMDYLTDYYKSSQFRNKIFDTAIKKSKKILY